MDKGGNPAEPKIGKFHRYTIGVVPRSIICKIAPVEQISLEPREQLKGPDRHSELSQNNGWTTVRLKVLKGSTFLHEHLLFAALPRRTTFFHETTEEPAPRFENKTPPD